MGRIRNRSMVYVLSINSRNKSNFTPYGTVSRRMERFIKKWTDSRRVRVEESGRHPPIVMLRVHNGFKNLISCGPTTDPRFSCSRSSWSSLVLYSFSELSLCSGVRKLLSVCIRETGITLCRSDSVNGLKPLCNKMSSFSRHPEPFLVWIINVDKL